MPNVFCWKIVSPAECANKVQNTGTIPDRGPSAFPQNVGDAQILMKVSPSDTALSRGGGVNCCSIKTSFILLRHLTHEEYCFEYNYKPLYVYRTWVR